MSILGLWEWVEAEAGGASLPMTGKRVSLGGSIGQDPHGRSPLRDVAAWRDCVRDGRIGLVGSSCARGLMITL